MNPVPETAGEHDLRRLRTLYRALGDPTRLRMVGLLAEIGPMPTFARARKWVGSISSIASTPGPHQPTCRGSMTNAQTRSRGAAIWVLPVNCTAAEDSRSSGHPH